MRIIGARSGKSREGGNGVYRRGGRQEAFPPKNKKKREKKRQKRKIPVEKETETRVQKKRERARKRIGERKKSEVGNAK